MTEREEEENGEFWLGEVEMVEAAYVVATKEKDAEIARLRAAIGALGGLSIDDDGYWAWEHPRFANGKLVWIHPNYKDPAEFARRALDGKP